MTPDEALALNAAYAEARRKWRWTIGFPTPQDVAMLLQEHADVASRLDALTLTPETPLLEDIPE